MISVIFKIYFVVLPLLKTDLNLIFSFVGCLFNEVSYSVLFEMAKKSVYVVFKGRKTGVFNSWPECHDQIDGFKGASYQKFSTVDEAYQALRSRDVQRELCIHTPATTEYNEPVQTQRNFLPFPLYLIVVFVIGITVGKFM